MAKRRPSGDGMVRKKADGRWEGRIVVGHKQNGSPIFRYIYGKTQRELLDKLNRQKEIYRDVKLTEQSRMTLSDWLNRWLDEYAASRVRKSTLDGYRRYSSNYINPHLGDKTISLITKVDIQKLYAKLQKEGRINEHHEHGYSLSNSTINSIHAMLHHALKIAEQEHLIAKNPTEGVSLPKLVRNQKSILTQQQLRIFVSEIEKDEIWHDFFYTEITTGLRRGEICGLRWEDFDEASGTLNVVRTIRFEGGKLHIGDTKTGNGTRRIILPPSTVRLLQERKKAALTEWIFPNPLAPEQPVKPNSAYRKMKQILKHASLPNLRFHDLRHTFATQALTSGVDAKTLSGILGHANASFTLDTYTHVTGDMQQRASEIVGNFIQEVML